MNNNEFTYIKEVAKQKSFSKASKALGISQPALSNYIKKLEDRTGVLLFDRSISPIEITEFGKAYLEYAEDVISATDRLNDVMSDLQDLKKGEIKIGSVVCFSTTYLPGPMSVFHKKYPGITFKLTEEKVPEIMNKCLLGDIDIFLTDGRIDGELKDEEFVLLNEDQHVRRMVDSIFEKAGFTPNVILQTSQTVTGLVMTLANMGISFVTETTIKYNNIKNHAYYYKVGSDKDAVRTMCVAYKKGKYISKACRKFIDTLKEELE